MTVTNRDSSWFAEDGGKYDIVAVDAPCSGEGMMRKEPEAVRQWSEDLIDKCSSLQREILTNAANAVAVGGFLIYSTCTFNRRENEDNAEFIAEELGLVPYDPAFPKEWGIPSGIGTSLPVSRFMPHKPRVRDCFSLFSGSRVNMSALISINQHLACAEGSSLRHRHAAPQELREGKRLGMQSPRRWKGFLPWISTSRLM